MRRIAESRAEVLPWKLKEPLFGQIFKGQTHSAKTLVLPTRSLVGIKQYLKSQLHDFCSLCLLVLMRILKPLPTALKTRTKLLASHHIKVLEAHRSAVTLVLATCKDSKNGSCEIARRHFQSVYRSHNVPLAPGSPCGTQICTSHSWLGFGKTHFLKLLVASECPGGYYQVRLQVLKTSSDLQ
jgi:hypothetical protein